jgi:hypothetical protein
MSPAVAGRPVAMTATAATTATSAVRPRGRGALLIACALPCLILVDHLAG